MMFSNATELCIYHHKPVLEHFHHPNKIPCAYFQLIPMPTVGSV